MSIAFTVSTAQVVGKNFGRAVQIDTDNLVSSDPTLAAAKVGQLTTRTSASVGTLTMASGHGIITGDRLDIYWTGGTRTGVTVGTVASLSVPFTVGSGDDLPDNLTAVTAMVPSSEPFSLPDTADLNALFVGGAARCTAAFIKGASTSVANLVTGGSGVDYLWTDDSDATNPLVSQTDTATVWLSHDDSAASRQVSVVAMID